MPAQLSIPQPCPASWAQMTPVAGGRYCAACAKVVVDFTRMSEAEVVAWLSRNGRSCGRFRPHQLAENRAPRSWAAWLAAAAVALSACEPTPPDHVPWHEPAAAAGMVTIRGRVLAEDHQGIGGAFVSSRADTSLYTRTLADGSFALAVPAALADSLLVVAKPPTEQGEYIPRLVRPSPNVEVQLRLHPDILGEMEMLPGEITLAPTAPPPPPPKLSTVHFTAPKTAGK